MAEIHIGYGLSPNHWFDFCHFSVVSILLNANPEDNYHFHIVSTEFPDHILDKFFRLANFRQADFTFHFVSPEEFEDIAHDTTLGPSAYYRLKLLSRVEQDKLLYLDSDTMIVSDIAELYNQNVDDYWVGMVEDKCSKGMWWRCKDSMTENSTFFNSGMMLLNLKTMHQENIEEKIFDVLRHYEYTDQDAINHVCFGHILSLPLKFNIVPLVSDDVYSTRLQEYLSALCNPVVVHPPYRYEITNITNLYQEYQEKYNEVIRKIY